VRTKLELVCKITLLMLTGLLLVSPYLPVNFSPVTFLFGSVILAASFPLMNKSFQRPTLIFVISGIIFYIAGRQHFSSLVAGINSMLSIVAIIIIMQLFSIPIQVGGYDTALETLMYKRFRKGIFLFAFVTVTTHLLGSFLLFGTIPVTMSLFGKGLKRLGPAYEQFVSAAITRGYALVVLWAPGAVNVLLILQATGLKWSDIFIPALLVSLMGIVTSCLLEGRTILRKGITFQEDDPELETGMEEKDAWFKAVDILLVIISLIVLTVLQERLGFLNSTNRIMTAGIIVAFFWVLKYLKSPELGVAFRRYFDSEIVKTVDLAGLFVSMGLFSKMVEYSGIMGILKESLPALLSTAGFLSLVLIPAAIIACALIGIHPFITIVLLGNILSTVQLDISHLALQFSLAIGGAVSYTVSPFAGIVLTMAKYVNRSPLEISFKWNGLFNIVFFCEVLILIYIIYIY